MISFRDWKKRLQRISSSRLSFLLICAAVILLILGFARACIYTNSLDGKTYRIGYDGTWYPVQLHGKDKNMLAFAAELLKGISSQTGVNFEFIPSTYEDLVIKLEKGQLDAFLGLSTLQLKFDKFYYSDPFYLIGPVLIVPSNSQIKTLNDLDGKLIGIRRGTSMVLDLQKFPSLAFSSYGNILSALVDLDKNLIDAVVLGAVPAYVYTKGFYLEKLKVITMPLTQEGLSLIASGDETGEELVNLFNRELKKMKDNGEYDHLLNKWELYNPEKP